MALYSVSHEKVSPMTPDTYSHKLCSRKVISCGGLGILLETRIKGDVRYTFLVTKLDACSMAFEPLKGLSGGGVLL